MKSLENRYTKVFGAYDILGIVGEDLDSPMVRAIAEAASVGLRESGHRVTHMGLASAPMTYWYGAEGGFDGSIAVTSSHLPQQHNGLKLCQRDAVPLSSEHGLSEMLAMLQKGFQRNQWMIMIGDGIDVIRACPNRAI
jgi:phosphomannomutase